MAKPVLWLFYDSVSKKQSEPVTTEHAQKAISNMTPDMIAQLFIWAEGWNNWHPLKSYLDSDQQVFAYHRLNPPMPPPSIHEADTVTDFPREKITSKKISEDTLSFSSIRLDEETISRITKKNAVNKETGGSFDPDEMTWSGVEKPTVDFSKFVKKKMGKREARHELKIEVLLISKMNSTFRSYSKNISLSGVLLEDTIPFDFYDTKFDVVIINSSCSDPKKSRVKLKAQVVSSVDGLTQRLMFYQPTEEQISSLKFLLEDYLNLKKKTAG